MLKVGECYDLLIISLEVASQFGLTMQVSVRDNGQGCSAGEGTIFPTFYSGTRSAWGAGLGLYLCRQDCGGLHGGNLSMPKAFLARVAPLVYSPYYHNKAGCNHREE